MSEIASRWRWRPRHCLWLRLPRLKILISRLAFANAERDFSAAHVLARSDFVFPGCLVIRIANDKGRYRQPREMASA